MASSKENTDQGFGTLSRGGYGRMINRDGSFNVVRKGLRGIFLYDVFISLIDMPWWKFNLLVVCYYIVMNFIFACLYWVAGVENLTGVETTTKMTSFVDAFFFSAQTLTTVGYGRIAPIHFAASSIAAIESLLGLLGFALATGLLYGRFSRPEANVIFSNNLIIAPHKGGNALMFRMANKSNNQLIEAEVNFTVAHQAIDENGVTNITYEGLPLELKFIRFMPANWTLVHMIDDKSPLYKWNKEDYKNKTAEFLVSFKATDDTFMQSVHTRTSYNSDEIVWGAKFIRMFEPGENGTTVLHLNKISAYERAEIQPEVLSSKS